MFILTEGKNALLLGKHRRHKHAEAPFIFFLIYTSQQSALPPNIRTGKISLEINMKSISKPKTKIFECLN